MKQPPKDRYPSPEEFDDARFTDSFWAAVVTALAVMVVLGSYALTDWCGWTGRQATPVLAGGVVVWMVTAAGVYVVWARVRRHRRQGGRR